MAVTMTPKKVSKEAARRFLTSRQGFQCHEGKNGTLEAIKRLECIQIDPVRVVHCNHHLALYNRVSNYQPTYLDTLLYIDRAVFEYWCNEKSVIPIEEFRYFRYRMQNYMKFHSPFYERLKNQRRELKDPIRHVVAKIKVEGPLCADFFKKDEKVEKKTAKRVLNLLWDCGEVMVHHVEGNRRYYDLTARLLPKSLGTEIPSREEYERFMTEKYMKAYGFVDVRDWRFGWLTLRSAQRKHIVKEMLKTGELCPVKIEGVKHVYYVLEKYMNDLEVAESSVGEERVHFIAPLDNLIWNRKMISEIFDFDYAWEIYKVPEKRVYGYYTLPILYGTKFVGRIDPKLERASGTLIINSLVLEEERLEKPFIVELTATMMRFLQFHRASRVKIIKIRPKRLKSILSAELN